MVWENNDILESVKIDQSVIPSNTLSFAENALYVAEAVEKDFNDLFMGIGINELAVYESTGMQIVYEGEKLDTVKNAVINFFKSLWSKIQAAFEAAITKFESMRKATMSQVQKLSAADVDNCAKDSFGKTHKFADIDNMVYANNARDYIKKVTDEFGKLATDTVEASEIASKKEELEDGICTAVSGIDGVKTVSDMQKKIREKLLGEEVEVDKEFVKKNLQDIQKIVLDGFTKTVIKKLYTDTRKYIDDCISAAKKYDDNRMKVMNSEVSVIKSVASCMNSANNTAMDVCKRRYVEYRNILVKVAIGAGKAKKGAEGETKSTNESYQQDQIAAAFNW